MIQPRRFFDPQMSECSNVNSFILNTQFFSRFIFHHFSNHSIFSSNQLRLSRPSRSLVLPEQLRVSHDLQVHNDQSFHFVKSDKLNFTEPIYPVQNPCLAVLDRLSSMSSQFLECSVLRARPFKLCEGCIDYYARLKDLTDLLDKTYSDPQETINCKQFLESYDSIQIVAQLITFVENVWTSSYCDNCIQYYSDENGTVSYGLANDTVNFFKKKAAFDACIFNVTGQTIPLIPIDTNVTKDSNVCTICHDSYNDINNFFLTITRKNVHGTCMDVVDTMNYTRLLWSHAFDCQRHDPDYMAVIGVSFFIPTVVFVFYVSALFKGERKEKKLSRQKRLPQHSATAALIGTRTWLWSHPNA